MRFGFDKILTVQDDAVILRAQRARVLAQNIANAETPGYKARDFDFYKVLNNAINASTNQSPSNDSMGLSAGGIDATLQYRVPAQASLDGNTVDGHHELMSFMQNALQYQAGLNFLSRRFSGIIKAFKGE